MKKSILIIFVIVFSFNTNLLAQDAGSLLVGGGIAFPTAQNGDVLNFSPRGIYMLNDNLSVGSSVVFRSDRDEVLGDTFNRTLEFGLQPEARYFFDLGDKVKLYGRAFIGFTFGSTTFVDGNDRTDVGNGNTFSIGVNPGLFYSISDKLVLDIGLDLFNFRSDSFTPAGTNTTTTNNSAGVGINSFAPNFSLYWSF